jgi:hypothetical protein
MPQQRTQQHAYDGNPPPPPLSPPSPLSLPPLLTPTRSHFTTLSPPGRSALSASSPSDPIGVITFNAVAAGVILSQAPIICDENEENNLVSDRRYTSHVRAS